MKRNVTAEQIQKEYACGMQYKQGLGKYGMFRQNQINERFYLGDQWHGAGCGDDRPLVRQNVIKRIADYKMAIVGADPIAVTYSAEGVADTPDVRRQIQRWKSGEQQACDENMHMSRMAEALSDHFAVTADRVKFDHLKQKVMLDAYITGTGILYTYWDDRLETGLYADHSRRQPIRGDIMSEVLHIDNVFLGDPTVEELQQQPHILIAQKQAVERLQATAKRYGGNGWQRIRADAETEAGEVTEQKATVITRFWKQWDENGVCSVWGMQVCGKAVIRPAWCLGIRLYPLAAFCWGARHGCGYGESEIVHLIPNQIAINRMLTASVWSMMMTGMPIMVVNGDVVTQPITNDPGQIIPVYGSGEDVERAIRYVDPPAYSSQFDAGISTLISDTLSQAGVSGVMLGEIQPNNAAAILAVREASVKPMQLIRNRFFTFCEEVARIWAEFFVGMYGQRPIKLHIAGGNRYCDFDGDSCRNVLFSVRVDVEDSVVGDQSTTLQILNKLLDEGVITAQQYVSRLPEGCIPKQRRLLQELQEKEAGQDE